MVLLSTHWTLFLTDSLLIISSCISCENISFRDPLDLSLMMFRIPFLDNLYASYSRNKRIRMCRGQTQNKNDLTLWCIYLFLLGRKRSCLPYNYFFQCLSKCERFLFMQMDKLVYKLPSHLSRNQLLFSFLLGLLISLILFILLLLLPLISLLGLLLFVLLLGFLLALSSTSLPPYKKERNKWVNGLCWQVNKLLTRICSNSYMRKKMIRIQIVCTIEYKAQAYSLIITQTFGWGTFASFQGSLWFLYLRLQFETKIILYQYSGWIRHNHA